MFPVPKALPRPVGFRIPWIPPVILAVSSVDVFCWRPSEAPPIYRLPQGLATANSPLRKTLCRRRRRQGARPGPILRFGEGAQRSFPATGAGRSPDGLLQRASSGAPARSGGTEFIVGTRRAISLITPLVVGIQGAVRVESSRRAQWRYFWRNRLTLLNVRCIFFLYQCIYSELFRK